MRYPTSPPSSAEKAGHAAAARRPRSSSARSPNSASLTGREHAGGDRAGGTLGLAERRPLEDHHVQPALRGAPRDAEADDTGADDGDVRAAGGGHGFTPRFAGMIRISC